MDDLRSNCGTRDIPASVLQPESMSDPCEACWPLGECYPLSLKEHQTLRSEDDIIQVVILCKKSLKRQDKGQRKFYIFTTTDKILGCSRHS